jgi:cell division septum initiation protein DivIVA
METPALKHLLDGVKAKLSTLQYERREHEKKVEVLAASITLLFDFEDSINREINTLTKADKGKT